MSTHLVIAPVLIALLAAGLTLLLPRHARFASGLAVLGQLAVATALVQLCDRGPSQAYFLGDWAAPFGIALLADRVSALAVAATAWLLAGVLAFACASDQDRGGYFHPLFHVLWMGLSGAFLTADVFNLFVFFEVLLTGSYGLAMVRTDPRMATATLRYVAINLAGSALFLVAAGLLYGTTGTLSFADLAGRLATLSAADLPLAQSAVALLAVVFLLKAAALPLSGWLPQTYGSIAPLAAAAFTLLTKLGAYGLMRVLSLWGGSLAVLAPAAIVLLCGLATLLLAGAGAMASLSLVRIATWGVLGSSGLMLAAVSSRSELVLAGALLYLPASALSASALFLVADLQRRDRIGGIGRLWLLLASAGVAGLPPLATFGGKLLVVAGFLQAKNGWIVGAILAGGLMTLVGVARAGLRVPAGGPSPSRQESVSLAWLLGGVLMLMFLSGPAQRYAQAAAQQILQPETYVTPVMNPSTGRQS